MWTFALVSLPLMAWWLISQQKYSLKESFPPLRGAIFAGFIWALAYMIVDLTILQAQDIQYYTFAELYRRTMFEGVLFPALWTTVWGIIALPFTRKYSPAFQRVFSLGFVTTWQFFVLLRRFLFDFAPPLALNEYSILALPLITVATVPILSRLLLVMNRGIQMSDWSYGLALVVAIGVFPLGPAIYELHREALSLILSILFLTGVILWQKIVLPQDKS